MTTFKVLAGAAAALALLSGCGSGTTSSKGPKAQHSTGTSSPIQLAQCARAHGLPNFPDPTQAPDGLWQFPPMADNQQLPSACAALKSRMGGQGPSHKAVSQAEIVKLRQFAQCMRQHGIPDWPDPQNDGSFVLPPRISQGGKALGKGPTEACRAYLPGHGIGFRQQ